MGEMKQRLILLRGAIVLLVCLVAAFQAQAIPGDPDPGLDVDQVVATAQADLDSALAARDAALVAYQELLAEGVTGELLDQALEASDAAAAYYDNAVSAMAVLEASVAAYNAEGATPASRAAAAAAIENHAAVVRDSAAAADANRQLAQAARSGDQNAVSQARLVVQQAATQFNTTAVAAGFQPTGLGFSQGPGGDVDLTPGGSPPGTQDNNWNLPGDNGERLLGGDHGAASPT